MFRQMDGESVCLQVPLGRRKFCVGLEVSQKLWHFHATKLGDRQRVVPASPPMQFMGTGELPLPRTASPEVWGEQADSGEEIRGRHANVGEGQAGKEQKVGPGPSNYGGS